MTRFERGWITGIVILTILIGGVSVFSKQSIALLGQSWFVPILKQTPGFPSGQKSSLSIPVYRTYPVSSSSVAGSIFTSYACAYHATSGTYRCRRTIAEANGATRVDFGKSCTMWSECQGVQGGYETTAQASSSTNQCPYVESQCTFYCQPYDIGRGADEGGTAKRCLRACRVGMYSDHCYVPGRRCSTMTECTWPDIGTVEPVSDYHLTGGTKCTWNDQCRSGVCEAWWYFSPTQTDSQCTCATDAHCATGQVCGVVNHRRACITAPSSNASSARSSSAAKSSQSNASSTASFYPPSSPPPLSSQSSARASSWSRWSSQGFSSASSVASRAGMCASDAECHGYFCIDGSCMTCVPAPNDATDPRRTCPSSHYCSPDGRCLQKKAAATSCTDAAQCLSFSCIGNFYGRPGICACTASAPCPNGQVCSMQGECHDIASSSAPAFSSWSSSSVITESCANRAARIYRETLDEAMRAYQQAMLQCLSPSTQTR